MEKIAFVLNGCDISFVAIATKDITLEQLLKQCDKIVPDWYPNCEEKQWITGSGYCYPKRCDNCGQKLDWKAFKEHEENLQKKIAEKLMK